MTALHQLHQDVLFIIAQFLSAKELLYFTRINNQLHSLNTTNSSWSQQAWKYSSLSLELNNVNGLFHEWIINKNDYVFQNINNNDTQLSFSRRHQGLIPLSYWLLCKKGVCFVLRRWIICAKKSGFSTHVFDRKFAQLIVDTRNSPSTHFITLESGECEVLSDLNEKSLIDKLSPYAFRDTFPNYRPHLILRSLPYLSSLLLEVDTPVPTYLPNRHELFELVPNLRALDISLSGIGDQKFDIRQLMKYFPHLESLTLNNFHLTIQDFIDICAQPNLSFIELNGHYDWEDFQLIKDTNEVEYNLEFDGFNLSPASWTESVEIGGDEVTTETAKEIVDNENNEDEDEEEEENDSADDNDDNNEENEKFRVAGDKGVKFSKHCKQIIPAQMNEDLLYINDLLSNSSPPMTSVRARLAMVNYMKTDFDIGIRGTRDRPLRYLWHIRHQLSIIHQSLTKSIDKNSDDIIVTVNVENQPNKKPRLI